jgi:hypothetical protein
VCLIKEHVELQEKKKRQKLKLNFKQTAVEICGAVSKLQAAVCTLLSTNSNIPHLTIWKGIARRHCFIVNAKCNYVTFGADGCNIVTRHYKFVCTDVKQQCFFYEKSIRAKVYSNRKKTRQAIMLPNGCFSNLTLQLY